MAQTTTSPSQTDTVPCSAPIDHTPQPQAGCDGDGVKYEIRLSVRELVEFVLRSGDIDNRRGVSPERAMAEGSRLHRKIQHSMGPEYSAEVPLRLDVEYESYVIRIEGRADGVIDERPSHASAGADAASGPADAGGSDSDSVAVGTASGPADAGGSEALPGSQLDLRQYVDGRDIALVTIDEIKCIARKVETMQAPIPVHLAQAKVYAYIYALQHRLPLIRVRMTYCHIETEATKYFFSEYSYTDIRAWFEDLMTQYRKWADHEFHWRELRQSSIHGVSFPFPYREGQRELVGYVYRTILERRKLYLEAPTGVGKTISTLYPAVRSMGEGLVDKIFYLTAKTITRTVASDTLDRLRGEGLRLKSIVLTAKEKLCPMTRPGGAASSAATSTAARIESADGSQVQANRAGGKVNTNPGEKMDREHPARPECNPEACPYAKGHFDRVNDAIYEAITSYDRIDREELWALSEKYRVCPFELGLDISLFCDAIICDYNYVFDPHVSLKRYFADGGHGEYAFLIDEAHNLVDRGREMFSAELTKEDFLVLKRLLNATLEEYAGGGHGADDNGAMDGGSGAADRGSAMMADGAMEDAAAGGNQAQLQLGIPEATGNQRWYAFTAESEDGSGSGRSTQSGRRRQRHGSSARRHAKGIPLLFKLVRGLDKCNREFLRLRKDCESYCVIDSCDALAGLIEGLNTSITEFLDEEENTGVRDEVLEFWFKIGHFLLIYELLDENYRIYTELLENGGFMVKLLCVNPRKNLADAMAKGRSSILFSATLLPIQYHKSLLGGTDGDYEAYAKSSFNSNQLAVMIDRNVTSRYRQRSPQMYHAIARHIAEIVSGQPGNYLVFFPSHAFLRKVQEDFTKYYYVDSEMELLRQEERMDEAAREAFLRRFTRSRQSTQDAPTSGGGRPDSTPCTQLPVQDASTSGDGGRPDSTPCTLIGFCVLGGIFAEGIDLREDALIGSIIVGTGLPLVCHEREIISEYFGENGYDYAYRYPGMNKVLQAAGRVIRTERDRGIVALLDDRFAERSYQRMFPREWAGYAIIGADSLADAVASFWEQPAE